MEQIMLDPSPENNVMTGTVTRVCTVYFIYLAPIEEPVTNSCSDSLHNKIVSITIDNSALRAQ